MSRPSYVMQRYPAEGAKGGKGPNRHELTFERPYPHMRLFYVDHNNAGFDAYWVDAELLIPETTLMDIISREDMQSL